MFASSLYEADGQQLILLYSSYTGRCITVGNVLIPDSKYILTPSIGEHHPPSNTFSQN